MSNEDATSHEDALSHEDAISDEGATADESSEYDIITLLTLIQSDYSEGLEVRNII